MIRVENRTVRRPNLKVTSQNQPLDHVQLVYITQAPRRKSTLPRVVLCVLPPQKLRSVTCHVGSHGVACHRTQVNVQTQVNVHYLCILTPARQTGT